MTGPNDEFERLWHSGGETARCDTAALIVQLERRARNRDRASRNRNLRNSAGCLLIGIVFAGLACLGRTPLDRAASGLAAAASVFWMTCCLRRRGTAGRAPAFEQTLIACQQQLLAAYDQRIRVVRGTKHWFIVPFWLGLVAGAAAGWVRTGNLVGCGLQVAIATLVNAALWWANDAAGERYIQKLRREVEALEEHGVEQQGGMTRHDGGTGGYRSSPGFDAAAQQGAVVPYNPDLAAEARKAVAMRELGWYVGEYELVPGLALTITRDGPRLFVQANGQFRIELLAEGENHFSVAEAEAGLSFEVNATGAVSGLTLHVDGCELWATKMRESADGGRGAGG